MSSSTPASNSFPEKTALDKPALEVKHRSLLMMAVMMVTIIQLLDVTIANVALPHMRSSLGATLDTISWVLTSYIIAGVLVTPIVGWVSDLFGSRTVFIGAVIGFLISSMLCGMATTLVEMVIYRAIQGACAAFIGPVSQTILLDINPPSKQAAAMSRWGLAVMVAPIAGPMLGGFLTETFNWRWVFYINVPIGIPTLAILLWLLPSRPVVRRKLDTTGFIALAIGLGALQLMLDRGQHKDWFSSREIVVELMIALSAFWIYVVHTMTTQKPLFPNGLLKNRNFTGALFSMFVLGVANVSLISILPTMFQGVYGYTAFDTGLLLLPRAVGVFITMLIAARVLSKLDVRYLVFAGYCIAGGALIAMSRWSLEMDRWAIYSVGFVQGLGLGFTFMPMNIVAFSSLEPQYRPDAASIMNLIRNIGGSFGISVIVTLLARNSQISHSELASHVTETSMAALDVGATAERVGDGGTAVLMMIDAEINRQALMISYIDVFLMASAFLFIAALSLFFLKPMRLATPPQQVPASE
jgi:DHA2 family multidrug resistance protein